jgi:DeoR/GlpR family transcriptional regulator of sugar metabolism
VIPVERRRAIMQVLTRDGSAAINDLAEQLGVSHMTVRRDIGVLEGEGRVVSVSGGVALPARLASDQPHADKALLRPEEKAAIARYAAGLVGPGALVYLDAGTTTLAIAGELADRTDLSFVTNDLMIAVFLSGRSTAPLYLAAGSVDRANLSTEGALVAGAIAQYNIDVAFMSTSSFDLRGLSVPSGEKRIVKEAIVANATTTYLVTDSSKYGRVAALRATPLSRLDGVITDSGLSDSARESILDQGISLHIVDPSA